MTFGSYKPSPALAVSPWRLGHENIPKPQLEEGISTHSSFKGAGRAAPSH